MSISPVPRGIFRCPQISLALRNQDSGSLNSAIDRDNQTEKWETVNIEVTSLLT